MRIWYTHDHNGGRGESRLLLARSIEAHTGSAQRAEELMSSLSVCGTNGKPVIPGFDHFSVSHSGSTWAVLFADVICGLDIQYERKSGILPVAHRLFAPEDAEAVSKAFENDPELAAGIFFRIWTRREALIKATGTSVTDPGVPSVAGDKAEYECREWMLKDIVIPGRQKLHAAVCLDAAGGGLCCTEPVFTELRADSQRSRNGRIGQEK